MKVIDIARGNAHLISVKKDKVLYSIEYSDGDDRGKIKTILLDISLSEIGDSILLREEKAGNLLKWIKEYVKRGKSEGSI